MLLEPFVENSFKYSGLGIAPNSFLNISLICLDDNLYFKTENSKCIKKKKGLTEREGIGIQNVLKRLRLLYPNSHTISIEDGEDKFVVKLWIKLQSEHTIVNKCAN